MNTAKSLCKTAIISALYAVLTLSFAPISFGPVQFRISEALCVLPFFMPEGVLGLTVGCFISNFFGNGILDLILGTLATFLSSCLTYYVGRKIKNNFLKLLLGQLPVILFNAVLVPFTFVALGSLKEVYFISFLQVALGELTVVYTLGALLYFTLLKILKKYNR